MLEISILCIWLAYIIGLFFLVALALFFLGGDNDV
jgi:hypothetical protein